MININEYMFVYVYIMAVHFIMKVDTHASQDLTTEEVQNRHKVHANRDKNNEWYTGTECKP